MLQQYLHIICPAVSRSVWLVQVSLLVAMMQQIHPPFIADAGCKTYGRNASGKNGPNPGKTPIDCE
jgi:hypothetical protein